MRQMWQQVFGSRIRPVLGKSYISFKLDKRAQVNAISLELFQLLKCNKLDKIKLLKDVLRSVNNLQVQGENFLEVYIIST